ncbi:TGF-beta-activated kinase 1 and MAP3K7-binding protein 3 isoform X2 [Nasonia vitripennis]|uniref:RanBP2-type domain-containing protein n=1 Tax=Nasonia vitripennis TaxID=7425 RepID=A0A7M7IZS8_NASVI|nr:TGF-beta-activated kinase 1 and MAP3K7-binding protein 3 isoform X2 [Nasonia vitripennis]
MGAVRYDRESCARSLRASQKSRPPPGAFPPPPPQPDLQPADLPSLPLSFALMSRRSSAEDQPVQEFSQLRWLPAELTPAPRHRAQRPASLDIGGERAAMLKSEASSAPASCVGTGSFFEEAAAAAAAKGKPSFELSVNVTRNPAGNPGLTAPSSLSEPLILSELPPHETVSPDEEESPAAFYQQQQTLLLTDPSSPPPTSTASPPSTRSFTSVSLTLRQPSSEPQAPIDISSQGGSSLTYSSSSLDPRGFQSRLQISIGHGSTGATSARIRPPPVPQRPNSLATGAAHNSSRPPGLPMGPPSQLPRPTTTMSAPTTPSGLPVHSIASAVPSSLPTTPSVALSTNFRPTTSGSPTVVTTIEPTTSVASSRPQPSRSLGAIPRVPKTTSSASVRKETQDDDDIPPEFQAILDQVEDKFKPLVLDQLIRKERMTKALAAEKEKLESIKKEINNLTRLHETEESPKQIERQLRSEIYQLQLECDKLAEEVDRSSADPRVPLGETDEEFYQSIYTGQEFVPLPSSNSVPPPLPSQRPAWEPIPRRIAEPRVEDEEADGPAWICVRCTFGNHPLMSICEECNLPRVVEGAQGETQDIHIRVTRHHNFSPRRTVHNWVV